MMYPDKETNYLLTVLLNSNYYIRESRSNLKNMESYFFFSKSLLLQTMISLVVANLSHLLFRLHIQIFLKLESNRTPEKD